LDALIDHLTRGEKEEGRGLGEGRRRWKEEREGPHFAEIYTIFL
jgi:hypothetical protein